MERRNYIIAIDLGSSNVVVAVGEKCADGLVDVLSIVSRPVDGVNAGKIENIELVSRAIREAVDETEEKLGIRITEAYAGISGEFVRCARHTDHVFVYDPQNGVNERDVDALFDRMRNVQAPDEETIMERVPQNYVVDGDQEVKNPVGSFGRKLASTFNFVLCHKTPMQRLDMALKRLGIKMLGVIANTLAVPESLLTSDEKEEGVAVVDLGGGITDVTVYYRNVVRYIVSIPMGAKAINRDIRTMGVPEKHVEGLKLRCGSAVAELAPEDKMIRVNGRTARESKDILVRNLATVIEARATDIAEFVMQEIKDSGYAGRLAYGIVLTGGSAALENIDKLFHRVTGMEVRIAAPEIGITDASLDRADKPAHATAVGLLLKGAAIGPCAVLDRPVERTGPITPRTDRTGVTPQGTTSSAESVKGKTTPGPRGGFGPQQPQQPQQPLQPPQFKHIPPHTSQPVQPVQPVPPAAEPETQTTAQPPLHPQPEPRVAEAATVEQTTHVEEQPAEEPKRSKRWGALIGKFIEGVNKQFASEEDEEI